MMVPPAQADDKPKKPFFDYQCYESLRRQAVECRRDCGKRSFGDDMPYGCYQKHDSPLEGPGQGYWEKCEACEIVCAVSIDEGQAGLTTGLRPPCPAAGGYYTICGYVGPDPHVECIYPR